MRVLLVTARYWKDFSYHRTTEVGQDGVPLFADTKSRRLRFAVLDEAKTG
jgi:hypothetical protein